MYLQHMPDWNWEAVGVVGVWVGSVATAWLAYATPRAIKQRTTWAPRTGERVLYVGPDHGALKHGDIGEVVSDRASTTVSEWAPQHLLSEERKQYRVKFYRDGEHYIVPCRWRELEPAPPDPSSR